MKNVELRDYQKTILEELRPVPSIGLFMKTGSGKTITSLARFEENPTSNLLVICPQKIVTQWFDVIENHTDLKPCRYSMKKSAKAKNEIITDYVLNNNVKCVVVNFDILDKIDILDLCVNEDWTIIVDESHKFKNYGTAKKMVKVTERVLQLGGLTSYKIILTATPTEKANGGYIDLYTQLRFLGYLDMSYTLFKNRYCWEEKLQFPGMPFPIKKITGYRMDFIESEIKPILKCSCRYFAPKYGDYEPEHIKVSITKADNYAKTISNRTYQDITFDNVSSFRIGKKTLTSGVVTGTDEYSNKLKYQDNTNKADWLEEFLSNTDDIVSITYNYNVEKETIKAVCDKLGKKYVVVDGSVADKPAEVKKEFDVIIGQYSAFGESIDGLQHKCHLMVMYSMPESSEKYKQTIGRIDRVGQKEMPVYYYLCMMGTIDDAIYDLIQNKVEFAEKDLDELTI